MLEKEVNYLVRDTLELLAYLRTHATEHVSRTSFEYFNHPTDKSFYFRIEDRHTTSEQVVTAKGDQVIRGGVKTRKEVSALIEDIPAFREIAHILGLESNGRKSKIRHTFHIGNLRIDLDEWFSYGFGDSLDCRVEVEGEDEHEILSFSEQLKPYIVEERVP